LARAVKAGSGYPASRLKTATGSADLSVRGRPSRGGASAGELAVGNNHQTRSIRMRRISLILTGAVLCAFLIFAGSAAAQGTTKTCMTQSNKVVGKTVKGNLYSRYVNSAQKQYATCGYAKKAMNKILKLGLEEPKIVMAYRCTPTVAANNNNKVTYKCVFKGADSPMYVKLGFTVVYKS
jgi:hypothetical protein